MTQRMGQSEGQGKPQRLGIPYYLSHSHYLLPSGYLSIMGNQGEHPERSDETEPTTLEDGMMPGLQELDFQPTCSSWGRHDYPIPAMYAVRWAKQHQPALGDDVWLLCERCYLDGVVIFTQTGVSVMWRVVEVLG